jgi:hypothetical protein
MKRALALAALGACSVDGLIGASDAGTPSPEAGVDAGPADVVTTDTTPPTDAPATSYREMVLTDQPIAYYRLAEAGGSEVKDEIGAHAATYTGPVKFSQPGALLTDPNPAIEPADGGCVAADRAIDFEGGRAFTLEIWVNYRGNDDAYRHLFTKNINAPEGRENFGIYVRGGTLVFERWVDGDIVFVTSPGTASGLYLHVVGTYNGAKLALYVNGRLKDEADDVRALRPIDASLIIGCAYYGELAEPTLGVIDEAAIYARALTPERIAAHYHASGR